MLHTTYTGPWHGLWSTISDTPSISAMSMMTALVDSVYMH